MTCGRKLLTFRMKQEDVGFPANMLPIWVVGALLDLGRLGEGLDTVQLLGLYPSCSLRSS